MIAVGRDKMTYQDTGTAFRDGPAGIVTTKLNDKQQRARRGPS